MLSLVLEFIFVFLRAQSSFSFPQQSPKMDLEFGSKVANEFNSSEFLQFPRDRAGLFFESTETNTMFILTAQMKGYMRGNIKVDIIEEGCKMVITYEKPVQDMMGNNVIKKDVNIRRFTKAFKIPVGVILDRITSNFNEETSTLTITMPKKVIGILGTGIQEVKETDLVTQTSPGNLPYTADKTPKRATFQEDKGAEFSSAGSESAYQKEQVSQMQFTGFPLLFRKAHEEVEKHGAKEEVPRWESQKPKAEPESQKLDDMFQETRNHNNEIGDDTNLKDQPKDEKVCEEEGKLPKIRNKICVPVIAGSAVILSLIVFGIHFMRKKKQPGKRKE